MNDLPQNELFSAYLDGELTAGERAEMEQLLAANPAARQLLDELRALSTTLQSLPREKLGEDLSRQVLRLAEQRIPTESGPDNTEIARMPLDRSIFQRFATRRNAVWLALTASIAVMVLINEQRQGSKPVQIARQMAPAAPEKARESGPPPSMQAVHDVGAETASKPADERAEKKLDGVARSDDYQADKSSAQSAERRAEPPESSLRGKAAADTARGAATPPRQPSPVAAPKGATEHEPVRTKRGSMAGKRGQNRLDTEQDDRLDEVDESVLVVQCDVSPKAVASQAFDKLLYANGIAQDEPREQIGLDYMDGQKQAKDAKQQATGDRLLAQSDAAGSESLVYVEATPAQITATLAGLAAQPDVFLAVSVKPAQDEPSQELVRRYVGNNQATRQTGSGLGGQLQSKSSARSLAQINKPAAVPESPAVSGLAATPALEPLRQAPAPAEAKAGLKKEKEANDQPQFQKQFQRQQQLAQSSQRQRVLFVVRVVDGDQPPVATKVGTGVEADAATPAQKANDPAFKETAPPANSPARDK